MSSVFSVEAPIGDTTENQLKSSSQYLFEERGIKVRALGEKPLVAESRTNKLKLQVTSGLLVLVVAECSLYCAIPTTLVTV